MWLRKIIRKMMMKIFNIIRRYLTGWELMYWDDKIKIELNGFERLMKINDVNYTFDLWENFGHGGLELNTPFIITHRANDGAITISKDFTIISNN